jgi:hypothetical protein
MKKTQSTVVSSVLISGIIISIISLTYVWGRPLIQKTADKSNIDMAKSDLLNIKDMIVDSASTGNTRRYDINLEGNEILKVTDKIDFETVTSIPIVSSTSWSPLNSYELPFERQITGVTTDSTKNTATNCAAHSGDIKYKQQSLDLSNGSSMNFDVTFFNRTVTNNYDYACIAEDADSMVCSNDCGVEGETIVKFGTSFSFLYLNSSGYNMNIMGKEIENEGVLGEDEMAILIARSINLGDSQKVNMEIRFRTLVDPVTGDKIRINLTCTGTCTATAGKHTLQINKEQEIKRLEAGHSVTESVIKVNII